MQNSWNVFEPGTPPKWPPKIELGVQDHRSRTALSCKIDVQTISMSAIDALLPRTKSIPEVTTSRPHARIALPKRSSSRAHQFHAINYRAIVCSELFFFFHLHKLSHKYKASKLRHRATGAGHVIRKIISELSFAASTCWCGFNPVSCSFRGTCAAGRCRILYCIGYAG